MRAFRWSLYRDALRVCDGCEHGCSVRPDGEVACGLTSEPVRFFLEGWKCPAGKWIAPAPPRPSLGRRIVSAARALTSGKVDAETFARRKAECDACPAKHVAEDGREFCRECGCPQTALSELGAKLWWRELECPRRRPGFANAEGPA